MIPMIAFVGEKKNGKTLILEKVLRELSARKRKIGVLKHTCHGFQLDYPRTDTSRLYRAGAKMVAISGKNEMGFYGRTGFELTPEIIRDLFFPAFDAILVEGYKSSHLPKVVVALEGKPPVWAKDLNGLIAVVSAQKPDFNTKHFKPTQIKAIANLVDSYIKTHRRKRDVKIYLDGNNLQIKPFIKDFFLNTISAMIGSLKGVGKARRIQITIELPEGMPLPVIIPETK